MDRFVIKGREIEVVFAQERRKTPGEMKERVVSQPRSDDDTKDRDRDRDRERERDRERDCPEESDQPERRRSNSHEEEQNGERV